MAGLFGMFDFSRPGKGVDINAPKKNRFFIFWELFFRKFSKIIFINVLYFICILPLFSTLILMTLTMLKIDPKIVQNIPAITILLQLIYAIPFPIAIILLLISIIIYGPATAGLTYILRNFAREEHAWFSDLYTHAKKNFKQAFILGIIDILVFLSFLLYNSIDLQKSVPSFVMFFSIIKFIAMIAYLIYLFMRFYMYTIMVTFDLKLSAIIKNGFIFSVLGLINNVIATVAIAASGFLFISVPILDIILLLVLDFAFFRFIAIFTTYPIIDKYMLRQAEAKTDQNSEIENNEE